MLAVLVGLIAAEAISAADWGNFSGKFIYDGTPPKPQQLPISKDPDYCGKFPDETIAPTLLTGPGNGIRNVYVWLKTTSSQKVDVHPDLAAAAATPAKLTVLRTCIPLGKSIRARADNIAWSPRLGLDL